MKHCSKCGKEIDSGYLICSDCLKSEKTADEMLKSLGYKENSYVSDDVDFIQCYSNKSENSYIIINPMACNGGLIECKIGRMNVGFTIAEFKAIAKKIEELGW